MTNKIIEDMLGVYVMDQPSKWEYYIHLIEFPTIIGIRPH
jgi:hypothetical protein